ncbi:hypothetical protein BIY27_21570 [Gibbsiella quercinecans]|uniref:hypothetical protein n=1 Tax=Gibbsiella quercinecans TaxID=929813 RepID=UPI000EF1861D|nr:hypothetical protein [Gibbsiella quercinecans]RLM05032.1 hypothetical protein BIY27_21570 [Gibbsiella quercinecans]
MITGKLDYHGIEIPNAVGVCATVQSTAQNGMATEWQGRIEIFPTEDSLGVGSPLVSYPLLGWVDNDKAPISTLEALAIELFFPTWTMKESATTETEAQPSDRSLLESSND